MFYNIINNNLSCLFLDYQEYKKNLVNYNQTSHKHSPNKFP